MQGLSRVALDIIIFLVAVTTTVFLYQAYGVQVLDYVFGEPQDTIVVNDVSVQVSIARTPEERRRGLSGVTSLGDREGKLFIFEEVGDYGFWMKDMEFAIDIFWINENLEVVHIAENVLPSSYPAIYTSPFPARFVLETNAFFADTFGVNVGDRVGITANDLPADLRAKLTE